MDTKEEKKDIIEKPSYTDIYTKLSKSFPDKGDEQITKEALKAYEFEQKFYSNFVSDKDGNKYFNLSSFMSGSGNFNDVISDANRLFSPEQVQTFVQYPNKSRKELRDVSRKLYNYIQEYKQLVKRYGTMLNYYPVINPTDDIEPDKFLDTLRWFEGYNYKTRLPQITQRLLMQDVFFGYELSQNGTTNKILKELPFDYCKLKGRDRFGVYKYKFDLTYFTGREHQVNNFPPEFGRAYKNFRDSTNKKSNWFEPNNRKQFAFKFDTALNYALPYFTGLFVDLVQLQEVKSAQAEASKTENYKLIHFKMPINEKEGKMDDYLINPDDAVTYHNNAKNNLPVGVGLATNPFQINVASLKGSNEANSNIVERHFTNLLSSAGMSRLLSNSNTTGSTGLEASVEVDNALMFNLLRQYEAFFNRQIFYKTDTTAYEFSFLNSSVHNEAAVFEKYLKAGQGGLNRFYITASLGIGQLEAIYGRKIEKKLGLDELFNPMESSHTQSGSDSSTESIDPNVSDEGSRTRDKE
jgi:hypothetical protein